jgi:catalase
MKRGNEIRSDRAGQRAELRAVFGQAWSVGGEQTMNRRGFSGAVHRYTDGDMVRSAYTLRPDDNDWGQANTLVRRVMDDAARQRLVSNVVGHLRNGVSKEVLDRVFEYWKNIDHELGQEIEAAVRNGSA